MNDPIEKEAENVAVAVSNTEQDVVTDTMATESAVSEVEESVATEMDHVEMTETETITSNMAAEEATEVVADAPVQEEAETVDVAEVTRADDTVTHNEMADDGDPFGPIRQVLRDFIGEG